MLSLKNETCQSNNFKVLKPLKVIDFGLVIILNGIVVYGSISSTTFLLIHGQWSDGW
jgi:hypothetical protein